ncbi:hypothetical protein BGZ60DRAFT_566210 [Tricladium varicosporioides]|nr:hypothetical protein BGZ60DRAFT_566210 [Hymenoscyphus varicosporioides]
MPPKKPENRKNPRTPVSDKNSKFRFEDNPKIEAAGSSPYQLNTPRDLTFRLTDIKGRIWTYRGQKIDEEQWENKKWIDKANAWYDQIIMRTCKAPDDPNGPNVKKRAQWSHHEKNIFRAPYPRADQGDRWRTCRTLRIGEPLVTKTKRGAGVVRHGWIVSMRTWTSLRYILRKWPDTRETMRRALSKLPNSGSDLGNLSDDIRQSIVEEERGEDEYNQEQSNNEDEMHESEGDDNYNDDSDDVSHNYFAEISSDDESLIQRGAKLMVEMRQVQEERGEENIQRQLTSQRQILKDRNFYHSGG